MTDRDAKVVDIEKARERLRARTASRQGASARMGGRAAPPQGWRKIVQWIQFIAFLAVMAYFLRLCQGG